MKHLIVLRHAKSDWHVGAATDHDRPLNARGRRDAPRIGAMLSEAGFEPELVLSSDSVRTRQTLELASATWQVAETRFLRKLYHAGLSELRGAVASVPDAVSKLLVVGHNPGWEDLVSELCGDPIVMKTAYAYVLCSEHQGAWSDALAAGQRWRITALFKPRS